jgi:predicted anti-sigma-YlaC factor YlaD
MNSATHISQDDLYLFALQLLPEAEMQGVAMHLKDCPPCRAQVAEAQGDMAIHAVSTPMKTPPSQARERLLHQVAKEKKMVAVSRPEPPAEPALYPRNSQLFQMEAPERDPRRGMGFAGWAGWAVAAGLLVAGGLQFQQRQKLQIDLNAESAKLEQTTQSSASAEQVMQTLNDPSAMQVSLHIPQTKGAPVKLDPEGHATYVPGKASLVFVASHLDPLQPAKTYELWLLPVEVGAAPIPAGLFKPDANGNASVVMPTLPPGVAAKGFGVTVENEGGSQKPTAPIVLAGL